MMWLVHRLSNELGVKKHLKRHEATTVNCPICKQLLQNKYSLKQHIRRVHGERNHPCTICVKKFKSPLHLRVKIESGVPVGFRKTKNRHVNEHSQNFFFVDKILVTKFLFENRIWQTKNSKLLIFPRFSKKIFANFFYFSETKKYLQFSKKKSQNLLFFPFS